MIADDIREILDKHLKWLNNEDGGERADLRGADLCGADLRGADLCGAKVEDSVRTKLYPLACPESGAFIAWKKY